MRKLSHETGETRKKKFRVQRDVSDDEADAIAAANLIILGVQSSATGGQLQERRHATGPILSNSFTYFFIYPGPTKEKKHNCLKNIKYI
ncbi:hypothetical protein [Ferrovum sp.]|uniref:hypothetical protein n=1 Tax=Ferrovum sp. TaxID=2609467 RepID=UPI00262B425B|nr:hypothetical protein [Ferrovum sp.]